ncbi:MAG: hypothetical protein AB7S78_13330 [Candidatus Omnitrophota bacterium]
MMKARHNPFSAQRMDTLAYRFLSGGWEEFFLQLEQHNYRAAIVGPHGSGKTTLLEHLGTRLQTQGYRLVKIFVNTDTPFLKAEHWKGLWNTSGSRSMILVDGADLLPAWQRGLLKLVSRRAKGLVTAGHSPLGLPVLLRSRTSPELLEELLDELAGPLDDHLLQKARSLFLHHNGNIRDILRDLYMVYADQWGHGQGLAN